MAAAGASHHCQDAELSRRRAGGSHGVGGATGGEARGGAQGEPQGGAREATAYKRPGTSATHHGGRAEWLQKEHILDSTCMCGQRTRGLDL